MEKSSPFLIPALNGCANGLDTVSNPSLPPFTGYKSSQWKPPGPLKRIFSPAASEGNLISGFRSLNIKVENIRVSVLPSLSIEFANALYNQSWTTPS